ncbi:helix-turn-helix domain-containing protein [Dermacoccus abyssi]|uniref:Helix-turn-helix domain-containing protein n=1 Tax=Dermacoccus abyssi TaxID=322596 RepID=A0ABX5Z7V2_9MICO|nr:helix-turn-helix domain-containing protein [Dermacoccus abyssi]
MAGLSNEQQENVWALWAKGESIRLIARTIGVSQTPVRTLLRRHGGVKPPPRARNRRHLSLSEREEISRGLAAGLSCRVIAARLGRHHTSISREVARHGGPGTYRAASADAGAWRNARRPKPSRLHRDPALSSLVAAQLERGWSPTQIAHWLRREQQDSLSHESIYHAPVHRPDPCATTGKPPAIRAIPAPCARREAPTTPRRVAEHGLHSRSTRQRRRPGRSRPLGR